MKKSITVLVLLSGLLFSNLGFSWTNNHEWEEGDTITWNVPYQSQKTFRNWTSACMPTAAAMIVNFFYSGASFENFNGNNHEWNQTFNINNPYQTTGQRMYAQGIEIGQGGTVDTDLNNYLMNYPKSGIKQYYNNGVTNQFGPLSNERWPYGTTIPPYRLITTIQGSGQGLNTNLASYMNNKHSITSSRLASTTIQSIKNHLYSGPVLISIRGGGTEGHVMVIKGVNDDGNLIINDPWGGALTSSPGNTGSNAVYTVNANGSLSRNNATYFIKYAYHYGVRDNFTRANYPFSPYNVPVEASVKFHYDGSGVLNYNYDGDGDYANIRNGFSVWNPQNNLKYFHANTLGFLYTETTIGEASNAVRWIPEIPQNGSYRVLVGFLVDNANSSNINYTVHHTNGNSVASISQKNSTNSIETRGNITYKTLGNYCFSAGANKDTGSVHLSNAQNEANEDMNIDIVKFVYIGNCDNGEEPNDNGFPYFDGAGSLIDPERGTACSGCGEDLVKLHSRGEQSSAGFFQVFRIPDICESVDLKGLNAGTVEVRSWSGYGTDSKYYEVSNSSHIIPLKATLWNLIAFKTNAPIPTGQTKTITATCLSDNNSNVTEVSGSPMQFDNNYFWGGNGSLISHTNNQYSSDTQAGYGRDTDTAVLLRDHKTLSVFQVTNSSSCGKIRFKTPLSFNLSWKLWDEKDWRDSKSFNDDDVFTFPTNDYWWILKIEAPRTNINDTRIDAICEQ